MEGTSEERQEKLNAIELHKKYEGKIEVKPKIKLDTKEALSWAYTPGVAEVSLAIAKDKELAYKTTWKGNSVAVLSDGSRVLGLGNIGAEAGMPVMEGKAALFKEFGDINAIPLCVDAHTVEELEAVARAVASNFGGINLEDIQTRVVLELFDRLNGTLDIPVLHDDRHGTGVVALGALINALKLAGKDKSIKTVIIGAGSASIGITELLYDYGIRNLHIYDSKGEITQERVDVKNNYKKVLLKYASKEEGVAIEKAMEGADVVISASRPGAIKEEWLKKMADNAIIFTLANPQPEIPYDISRKYAELVATGRSDKPNQVNNVLVFPGIFRGMLDVRLTKVENSILIAAAEALANTIEPTKEQFIASPFNRAVPCNIARAVAMKAVDEGLVKNSAISKEEIEELLQKRVCKI
ncbi:MAG: NADP-dependent malic enzyme [Methanobacteriota archaeon]|nr:MAG: NADP-dependent malic enzyme [Euryarchaeota archaeon]